MKKGVFVFPNGDKYGKYIVLTFYVKLNAGMLDVILLNHWHADGEYVERAPGQIERHGDGTHYSRDGLIYSGKWENDKMNGEGNYPCTDTSEGFNLGIK